MVAANPRKGGAYRDWKKACRYRDASVRARCHRCKQAIDYSIPPNDSRKRPYNPDAYEPDHIKPVATHPHLSTTLSNGAPCHARCNRSRQDKPLDEPGSWVMAEDWADDIDGFEMEPNQQ